MFTITVEFSNKFRFLKGIQAKTLQLVSEYPDAEEYLSRREAIRCAKDAAAKQWPDVITIRVYDNYGEENERYVEVL